MVVVFITTKSI